MPRNTSEQTAARREQITVAAMRCFSRNGFHATSMDDVIAEAGLSAGAVYRYFPGKSALVGAAVEHALALARGTFDELLAQEPPPSLSEAVSRTVDNVAARSEQAGYDVSRLAVTAWGEALRDAQLAELARTVYTVFRGGFTELVRRSQHTEQLPPGTTAEEVGAAVFSLVPGFLLQHVLLGDVGPEAYARGVAALLRPRS